MKHLPKKYKRVVVKVGSSLCCPDSQDFNLGLFDSLSKEVSSLLKEAKEVVLVSSGAIAFGMHLLKINERPKDLCKLQSLSAIGQNELMHAYRNAFESKKVHIAQILLTYDDFNDRRRFLNAKGTLLNLLNLGSVPIINENDTISTEEIKFGDNDRLSALVASLISADLLIILSDVDGLLDQDAKTLIRIVEEINHDVKALACPTNKKRCVGGMITKVEAANISVSAGIPCVIANGRTQGIIAKILEDPFSGGHWTVFVPKKECLDARKRWIAFGTKIKGEVIVDEGAKNALLNKKSLLSVGIVGVSGNFQSGDIVTIADRSGDDLARGKISVSSGQLEKVMGKRFEREIIHRDNIVIL